MTRNNKGDRVTDFAIMWFCCWAVVGICSIVYAVGLLNGAQTQRDDRFYKSYISSIKSDAHSKCVEQDRDLLTDCIYDKLKISKEALQSDKGLTAQQISANSAVVAAIVSILGLVASSVGVYLVKRTLDATLKAVEDTTKATEAMLDANRIASNSQRPWIAISNIKCKVSKGLFSTSGTLASFQLTYDITNFGRTPATSLIDMVHHTEFVGPWATYGEVYRLAYDNAPNIGQVIFPDQRQQINRPHAWYNIEISDKEGHFNISAVVYCTYRDEHGNKYITGAQIIICKVGSSENMMYSLKSTELTNEFTDAHVILDNRGNIVI